MNAANKRCMVLATDLDGTLIPLPEHPHHVRDLARLCERLGQSETQLVFVTGRSLESVERAIEQFRLPEPTWIIADGGSSIAMRRGRGVSELLEEYHTQLQSMCTPEELDAHVDSILRLGNLDRQEPQNHGQFKRSFYCELPMLAQRTEQIEHLLANDGSRCGVVSSVAPVSGVGLIDILPRDVSKASALRWWAKHTQQHEESIVYAGDSGNDLPAFQAGFHAIMVGNVDRKVAQLAHTEHHHRGWRHRLYLAKQEATSGVLEGCEWFGLLTDQFETQTPWQADSYDPAATHHTPLGATPMSSNATHFCVWAPKRTVVDVELHTENEVTRHALRRQPGGYFAATIAGAAPGMRYQYLLDKDCRRPDPASQLQPQGVHGPSEIVLHDSYPWQDAMWHGVAKRDLVIYELHIGTFTEAGSYRAAIDRIAELKELGITAIELMPLAQCPGKWNWGYDGVSLFAPSANYGSPDELKLLVDACHAQGLAVLLDVVYNHLGPEGNYLRDFGPYFSRKHHTPWGEAFGFDSRHARPIRKLIVDNARYWIETYHLDGLRLDAVHFLFDDNDYTILDEVRDAVSAIAERTQRHIHLIAEANIYDHELVEPTHPRRPYDAIWCDDLMHAIYSLMVPHVRLTRREYSGYADIAEALQHAFLYTGPQLERITPAARAALRDESERAYWSSLITALQTHDSVGNHPHGMRFHELTSVEAQRAAASIFLLLPTIPMIFMGEECSLSHRFPFFVDFEDVGLRQQVDRGRAAEYPQHAWAGAILPSSPDAFHGSKWTTASQGDEQTREWYRRMLTIRRMWRELGGLDPHLLTTSLNAENGCITLRYTAASGVVLTVIARLVPLSEVQSASICTCHVAGEILADSSNQISPESRHDGSLEISPNSAIVVLS